jgi:transcriptional regulator with XRE-family HTH domain
MLLGGVTLLGARLKLLRKARGLTQLQVGEATGINRETYSHYENERRKLKPQTLTLLAQFYEVSADYLLGVTDKPHSNEQEFIETHRETLEQLQDSISAGRLELDGCPLSDQEKECLLIALTIALEKHTS